MKWLLFCALLLGVVGCRHLGSSEAQMNLAVINFWSAPNYPSLTFIVRKDGKLILLRSVLNSKLTRYVFSVKEEDLSKLVASARGAYQELEQAKPDEKLMGGVDISICLSENPAKEVTFHHYAKRSYNFPHVSALFESIDKIVPLKYRR